jgi:hypothetical protein
MKQLSFEKLLDYIRPDLEVDAKMSQAKGAQAKVKKHDNFNYFASQCCIQIEMAFGLMVNKWGILNRPLPMRL